MSLSCGIAAETWLRIPRKRTGEEHTIIMVDLEAPVKIGSGRRRSEIMERKEIHVPFLRQLEEEGVYINGRWNPALKLPSVVICAAQE